MCSLVGRLWSTRVAQRAVGVAAQYRDARTHRPVEVQHDREPRAEQDAGVEVRREGERRGERRRRGDAVVAVRLPRMPDRPRS